MLNNKRNALAPPDQRLDFRIGVNLGDVIVEEEDIHGNGVNIASRLEATARAGGVAISASVRDQVGDRLGLTFEDAGEQTLKNLDRPVRVFHVGWDSSSAGGTSEPVRRTSANRSSSVAVLPFTNMSDDPEQAYFTDGLVEDLITDLSKMPGFFVIAGNSTFAKERKDVDVRAVARELNVHYVLQGSVRKAVDRVRITAQLVEGAGGTHIWAEKFEGTFEDVFDLQDQLTESIVGALEPSLRRAEIERARQASGHARRV